MQAANSDSPTILIIDDSPVIRAQLTGVLEKEDFNLVQAEDGKVAIDILESQGSTLSLVFCDLRMPKIDGMGVLRWLDSSELKGKLPFLMLTTEGSAEFIMEARKLGAKGWIVKPFNGAMIVKAAHRLTQNARVSAQILSASATA